MERYQSDEFYQQREINEIGKCAANTHNITTRP